MPVREWLEAFLSGERPARIPYTIYGWEHQKVADDPRWQPLYEAGLGVTQAVATAVTQRPPHQAEWTTYQHEGRERRRLTLRTPVGEIYEEYEQGWRVRYYLESADDYRVMTWLMAGSQVTADFDAYHRAVAAAPEHVYVHTVTGRTPVQSILVDWVGLEAFGWHLMELREPLLELYDAALEQLRRVVEITAAGPGRYVACLENFTAETMGPRRFAEFHLPVYRELWPLLRHSGKVVGTHYDGKLAAVVDLLEGAPTDMIESLTPPPEGDMTLAEARAKLPDKLFWSNLNVGLYALPPAELRRIVLDRVAEGAPDGRLLAFEVSEHLPRNWFESMPVVLEALRETEAPGGG